MIDDFDRAFTIVIGEEGGYSNDPNDPGGETNFGICKRDHPDVDIKNLTLDGAKQIYRPGYWDTIKGDELPWPMCLYLFDASVNQGAEIARKILQRALQTIQDGVLGPQTMALAAKSNEWHAARVMAFRAIRYQSTRNFDIDGEGWLTRLFEVTAKGSQP